MANKKIKATATLFLDFKNAKNDFSEFFNYVMQGLNKIETASDKMTVFKDMVSYITQVDRSLTALKTKNADAFNKAFGGLDVNLKQVVEMLMGITSVDIGNLDVIKTKIDEIVNSGKKTGHNDTFKQIAKDLNNLYRAMGYDGDKLNIDDFSGSGKFEQKLKLLTDAVEDFGLSFGDVSDRIANAFGLEGATNVGKFGQKVREELAKINVESKEIELLRDRLNSISNMKVKVNGLLEVSSNLDASVMSAEELISTMTKLYNKLQNREAYSSDLDYYKDYVKYVEVAKKIKALEAKPAGMDLLTKQTGDVYDISLEAIEFAEEFAKEGKSQILDALDVVEATAKSRAREVRLSVMKELGFGSGTGSGDGGGSGEKQAISYQKLIVEMLEINRLQDDLDNLTFGTDEYNKAEERLESAKQKFVDLYVAADKVDDVLDVLNEISIDGMIDFDQFAKLCDIISVDMTSGMSQFKETTVEAKSAVDNLSESIKKVYSSSLQLEVDTRNGNASGKEFMNLFGADGIVSTTQGADYQVDTDTLVQQLVANLNRDIVMSLHNHANGDMSFSPSDINSFAKMYYGQGTKINGIIANGFIHTIDFNSIGQEVAIQIAQDYQDGIQHLFEAKNIAQFASFENGSIVPSDLLKQAQASNPEYYQEVIDQLQEAQMTVLRQAFEKNGAEFTLQSFGLDNIDELSTYLANVQKNTQNAIEPVEKLKNLISTLRPSADLSEFTEVFDKFKNGAIDGSQALNQVLNLTPNNISDKTIDETNQKLREQEQLWENVKITIKNGIGEAVGIESLAETLELIEREIKEGILTSIEECIARFKEWNNISEEESLTLIGKRERIIDEHSYGTYLIGADEVVSKEEADKLKQLSVQQEQLYQNLRSAIKGTLSDIVDVDDMTYAFDTIEKEIEAGLLATLEQCIERFKLLIGLDDKRLTSIKDDQRVADSWDYYQGNRYVDDGETVIDSSEYNKFLNERAELLERISSLRSKVDGMPDTYFTEGDLESFLQEYCVEIDKLQNELAELKVSYEVLKDANQFATEDLVDYEREVADLNKTIDDLQTKLNSKIGETGTGVGSTNAIGDSSLTADSEVAQLELIQQKLLEVKTAVDAKTQAFEEEYVTVDSVVDAEIISLQSLITQLHEVVTQINLINDGFNNINTNAPKIELKSAPVDQSVATENIHYVTDPQGRPVTMYRGIRNSYSGLVSNRYHGGTFSTDNLELAKEYAGELGKVEKVLLSMKNPLEIDGHGAFWNQIEYIGDNSDEASQKLYELNASIRATKKLLADAEKIPISDHESKNILRGFITEEDTKRAKEISYWTKELKQYQEEKADILADTSNPYGKKNTNELVEIAKAKGYDGVIFKDIIDSATGDVKDLSTVMVTFEQDQIHYLETISSTFESSVDALKNHFGDVTKHISASSEEVESSIRKMVELRGKLNAGEISEDEYNAFISGNSIARDYEKLAKRSMAVPDFITGALDGDEFDLKHVIQHVNDMLDNMRNRVQKIAKAFGKEGVPLDKLLVDSVNVAPVTEPSVDEGNVVDEVEQLNKLQTVLTEVKNAVLAKTKAFIDEGNIVGQVVGKEVAALMKLAATVDSIVPKVDSLVSGLKGLSEHGADIKITGSDDVGKTSSGGSDASPVDPFKTKLSAQKGAFSKYRNDVKDADYLTEDLKKQIDSLGISLQEVTDPAGLDNWLKRFANLKADIQAVRSEFEQMNLGSINLFQRELTNSFNKLTLPQKEDMLKEYLQAIVLLNRQKQAVEEGHAVEVAAIKEITTELQKKINAQIEANKVAKDAETAQKKNSKFGDTAAKNATAKYNSLIGSANSDQFTNSKEVAAIVGEYEKAYKAMIAFRNELRNSDGVVSEADEAEFKRLTTECNEYAKALDKLIKSTMKLKGNKANPNDYMLGSDFVDDAQGRKQALTDFVKSVYDIDVAAENFKKDWNEVVFAVDNGDGTFTQMTATFTAARNEIIALAGDTNKIQGKFESFIDGVKNRLQSLSQYFIATVGIYDVWNVIKQGINYVREIDSALTELKKVTDATETSYNNFLQTASKTAATLGSTVSDFVDATADFARLGYDLNQASQLAEAASVYKNVGDGIDDVAMASESIISTMKAFGIEANNAMGIVDRFNEVGNNFAISSTGIGEAMQRSASALYESGNTIDESIALITAANSVIQNPEQVGTALKTLALRLRGAKVELEEAGEDVEGMAESTSQLQAKLLALTHGKVDIMLDEDTFKNTTQILREMAGAWEEMTDIERSAALELMGGKRQANILASVIKNFDTVEDVIATSMNSSGSAIAENEKYLDSIQGKIDLFNNSLQTMWMNFIDSKTVKNIVSLGTALIKLVDTIGLIPTGVGLFAGWKFAAAELEKAFGKTNISTKELKKNINDYINQQKAAGQTATATAQEVVMAEQQKTAAQTQATAVGAAEEAQDKKNIATDLAGAAADKVKAESQKEENQTQIDGVVAGKAEENQDKKNIAIDLAGAGADVGAASNVKDIIKTGSSTVGVLGKIGTGIKAVGIALGKAALVMLAVKAATWAIGKAWETLDKNVIRRAEHIKEEVKSLQDSYESMKETLDSNLNTLNTSSDVNVYKTLEDEFAELAKGVDRYGNNISLTTDQYERYKAICQQIVGIQPSIAAGYDSATQAIGNNVNILEDLIELQRIQARQNAENRVSDENLGKFAEDALNDYNEALRNYRVAKSTAFSDLNAILYQSFKSTKQIYAETLGSFDFSGNGTEDDDFMEYVLSTLGVENIPQVIQSYFRAGQYDVTGFLNDYYDQIKENSLNFGIDYQSALNDTFTDIAKTIRTGGNDIKKANDALVDDFLIVPQSKESYDELGDASKNFITDWIKNSSQFKVDANQTEKIALENRDKIIDMVNMIAGEDFLAEIDGETISGQDLLDQIYNFDLTSVNWQEYKVKAESFVKAMWDAIGGAENDFGMTQIDLMNMFGFNFTEIESGWQTIAKQIDEHTDMTVEDVRKMLGNEMNAKQVDAFFKINWNDVDWNNVQSKQDILDIINKKAQEIGDVTSVKTYSVLVSEVESYNDILSQTSEIVSDNTEVTQEYKDSIIALGVSEEELAECFDENNGLIVKNAAALRRLVAQKKQDKQATVQQAKSMSQLQYKNTVQQLQQVVKAMAVEVRASGLVSSAALKTSESLREQISALKQTIQQYALLEISLSDAANAYSEFEAAKERDAQLTYGDSMIEMLQTINEGFKTGQVGTEAFQYAVKVIVPESEYAHIDNIEQRMIAIHDYIDKNPLFADWFTIDEGEFSITLDNINSFIDDAHAAGLFTSDSSGDFFLTEAIKNAQDPLKEFADQLGRAFNTEVTEGSVLAMLTELEKYDASWGNILTDLTTTPIDRAINDATTALEEALTAQEEFIRSGGDLNSDKYIELEEAVSAARGALDTASQAAIDNAQTYTQVEAVLKGMTGEVKYTQEQADALARSLGLINENGHIQIDTETGALILTKEQLDALNERLTGLTEPTILDVQLAYDEIDRQLQELNAYLSDPSNYSGTILTELNITNESEAKAKVEELTADRDAIELVYNITTTSTEESGTFEKLTTWEANGVQITISGDASAFEATVNETNAVEMDGKTVPIDADPTEANASMDAVDNREIEDKKPGIYMQGVLAAEQNISSIGDALELLPDTKDIYVNVHYRESGAVGVNGTAHVDGTAYSHGNWGAPRTEVALTGELGPEMVVRDGRWFTVGENGAEFTQIKKGDIIFNHKQTEDLLSKGYVTSRGRAYASGTIPNATSGTAYYKTFGGYVGDNDVFENGSDNWMDPWTNSFDDAADDLSDAADSISDAADDAEQVVDFIEMKLEEIESIIEKTSARISNFLDDTTSINSKDELYDELVKAEKDKAEVYLKAAQKYDVQAAAALSGVPQQYQAMARNGAIAIEEFLGEDQVEIAEKIQEYRDWAAKADEAENGHLEAIAAISAHRVEQLEDIATDFENIVSISKSHSDLLQAEMDFIEESGNRLSESYYEELKKHSQKQLNDMQNERVALQKILDDSVAAGDVIIGSDDWYSMLETIYEVDQEIIDCKTSLEEFQNAINELYWDNFDKLIAEIDVVDSELSNLFNLISDNDKIVDDMGNWTADGYTSLGLLIQQMEVAQQKSKEYGDAISKLKKDYKDGLYSTDEYNEKLAELTNGQYDAIKSYEDAKDAIIDLNKTRVDAVKDGIQKEIDAYEELISKKKESLDADKDARDFERSVEENNKSISDVERKIASLKGNTSSSAIAERRRLEEELRKLQQEREDLFYNESVENQQKALDKELESFQDAKNKEIEDLEEYLKNQEKVLQDSFAIVQENTQQIAGKLVEIAEDYGVTISDTVATPWIKGVSAIGTYEEQLNTSVSATTKNLEALKQQLKDLEIQADQTANSVINATHSSVVTANDGHQTSIKGYATGSKSIEYDQWALIDELGDELQLVPNKAGRLDYIKKGTGILNNTLTERLMDLAMDPTSMLENSRPVVGAPGIITTNNTFTIDASVGTLLHVEHLDGSNPAEVTKLVDKAWEKKMQTLNSSIKKFTR